MSVDSSDEESGLTSLSRDNSHWQARLRITALVDREPLRPGERRLPEHILPGLKAVGYAKCMGGCDWSTSPHRDDSLEVGFVEQGALTLTCEGKDFDMSAGDLYIAQPWKIHILNDPSSRQHLLVWLQIDVSALRVSEPWIWPSWLVLSQDDLAELTRLLCENRQAVYKTHVNLAQSFHQIRGVLDKICSCAILESELAVAINQLLLSILYMLRGQRNDTKHRDLETPKNIKRFLDELASSRNTLSQNWTVTTMAESCRVSQMTFISYCRRLTNMTPHVFLQTHRLRMAMDMLKADSSCSITDVAFECGFESSQHFSTLFHRAYGITPSKFRESS